MSYDEAVDILTKGRGSYFDPGTLDVFVGISRPLFEIYCTDDDMARTNVKGIDKYYKADVATFLYQGSELPLP